jgi:hypothetical protein
MVYRFVIVTLLAAILAGCATLNEDQCNTTDWYTLGNADGASGKSVNTINAHAEACTEYGIIPDREAWRSGWDLGIRQYCTPSNGVERGRSGRFNSNSCPVDLSGSFNEGYRLGKSVYDAKQAQASLKREIDNDIIALSEASAEDRVKLQLQLEIKRNRQFELQNRVNDAERAVDRFLYNRF